MLKYATRGRVAVPGGRQGGVARYRVARLPERLHVAKEVSGRWQDARAARTARAAAGAMDSACVPRAPRPVASRPRRPRGSTPSANRARARTGAPAAPGAHGTPGRLAVTSRVGKRGCADSHSVCLSRSLQWRVLERGTPCAAHDRGRQPPGMPSRPTGHTPCRVEEGACPCSAPCVPPRCEPPDARSQAGAHRAARSRARARPGRRGAGGRAGDSSGPPSSCSPGCSTRCRPPIPGRPLRPSPSSSAMRIDPVEGLRAE